MMTPLDIILGFAQMLIPLGVAVPALMAYTSDDWDAENVISVFWYGPLVIWIIVVVAICIDRFMDTGPVTLLSIVACVLPVGTTLLLLPPYLRLGKMLVNYQNKRLVRARKY